MTRSVNFISFGILLLGLVATLLGWRYANQSLAQETRTTFEYRMQSATQSLRHRLDSYTEVLRGLQGYFDGSEDVGRAEFRRYIMKLDLQQRFHGFRVIGFAPRVATYNKVQHEESIRNDRSTDPNGHPHYAIRPAGDRPEYYPITFLQPMAGNEKAFGFDFGSETERFAALQRARDSGEAAATGRIILVQDETRTPGFILMLPLYQSGQPIQTVEQRRAVFTGVIYAAFVINDLMKGVFVTDLLAQHQLKVIDGGMVGAKPDTAGVTIFDSKEKSTKLSLDPRLKYISTIETGGRQWVLEYQGGRSKAGARESLPLLVLFAGLSVTLLTFGIIRSLTNSRTRAQKMAEDITQELHSSDTRTRAILNSVLDGIITINELGIVASFSPAAENIFGYAANEVIGENIKILMPEPYHSAHDGYLHNYTSTGQRKIIGIGREVTGLRKDGSHFPMDLAVTEMVLNGQRMFTGIVRDITERKHAEAALLETTTLQHAILNSANYTIISTDPDGMILTFNAAAERMLGYSAEEMIGKLTPAILHDPQEVERRANELTRELEKEIEPGFEAFVAKARLGSTDENEWSYIHKDGSRFPVMLSITALRDQEGRISGFLGIGQDITERKQIERMKNEFVSTVSHELRTPLTSIRGSLGLIAGGVAGDIPAQAKTLVDIAYNNSERLVRLINDILDVEKIESGKLEFYNQNHELMPLLERSLADNHAYGAQLGVRFNLVQNLPGAVVKVDSDRLLQVMANLLSNAAKFSPHGETVSVTVSQPQPEWVRVAVQDHGPGIPPEFHERIFQKFAQADSSDTRQKGGTGLGLSISKALIEKMHGFIDFESTPGTGTTFFFDLPLQQRLNAQSGAGVVNHKTHILICEDDQDIASLLRIMLESGGFACDQAHDASEAKTMLSQNQYDAMTLDLSIPGQDGLALIRELRAQEATCALPIVVVSAKASEGKYLLDSVSFAVSDWISKPIEPQRLLAALHSATRTENELPNILHVEDDADIRQVTATLLSGQAHIVAAENLAQARDLLARQHFDLAILDIGLPDGSGLELLPQLSACTPAVPTLIFSAQELSTNKAGKISAVLVKSRTSNEKLLETIRNLVQPKK
ncbi:MAG: PAS domain S-box protein [Gammaproteobacteria bacterium]|nr:PAS domain S-box protein [Gammaproteobacteria bacterium]MBU1731734.1 PAS domain S-box protein [Gammaproteobacteria bacterium]MBU1892558.1 PAS domain S-box protein [Gammaproteobacteria bacterium]